MPYVDFAYYSSTYLAGSSPLVPEGEFSRWENQAELEIDARTRGRIASLDIIPDKVKDCTCAVTELLYTADAQEQGYVSQGLSGPVASWSNDGQSGTVDLGQSIYTQTGKQKEISRICRLYLGLLGLMYAGVMHYES